MTVVLFRGGALVEWKTTNGEFESASTETDADGIAFALLSPATYDHVVVSVHSADVKADKSSEPTPVYPVTTLKLTVSDETYLIGAAPLVFFSELKVGDAPAVKRLVNWYVDGEQKPDSYTNSQGIAIFSSRFTLGEHEVKAVVAGTDAEDVILIQALTYRFECVVSGYLRPEAPDLLSRYETYTLTVKAFVEGRDEPVADAPFMVKAKGVAELAMTVSGLNEPEVSTPEGVLFTISFNAVALTGSVILEVESGGVVKWTGVFKVGYYYKLGGVSLTSLRRYAWLVPDSDAAPAPAPIAGILKGKTVFSQLSTPSGWNKGANFTSPPTALDSVSAELSLGVPDHGELATLEAALGLGGCLCVVKSAALVDMN